jgi:isoquinoline 1-oxidoreductase alpha subunit
MKFTVNGKEMSFTGDEETPLLWVIRDEFDLKGTKFGCGKGLCGACTVHLNGSAIRSCVTPVGAIANLSVTTIEGIGSAEHPHPLQAAWQALNVPQCGYCQPGQLMSASALLAANPSPTDDDINTAMSGNICRCGTYPRIKKAIHLASDAMAKSVDLAVEVKA